MISTRMFASHLVIALPCLVSLSCVQSAAQTPVGQGLASLPPAATPLGQFIDRFYDQKFAFMPSAATDAGIHLYDNHLEDFSRSAISRRIANLKEAALTLGELRSAWLSPDDEIDAQLIDNAIKAELFDLEKIESWKKSPLSYINACGSGLGLLIKRNFAPVSVRLKSVISRMAEVPRVLASQKANLVNPPPEFIELGLPMIQGFEEFLKGTLERWARDVGTKNPELLRRFEAANKKLIPIVHQHATWMKNQLHNLRAKPKSKQGSFVLGAETLARKLLYEEMIDIPLSRLLELGNSALERDRRQFIETAKLIDPASSAKTAAKKLGRDHPSAERLIAEAQAIVSEVKQFTIDHHIVTIPSEDLPVVAETPSYAKDGSFATLISPGVFEDKIEGVFYYITLPDAGLTAAAREQYLSVFNRPVLYNTTIHETIPGHFMQYLYQKYPKTRARQLALANSNIEGWAHYAEQMIVEEGFRDHDPKMHLGQLSDALLRDCRVIVSIGVHTQGMTIAQGARIFEDRCLQAPSTAKAEAMRVVDDPTDLYYTIGKLEIYKLRADYQNYNGNSYSLQKFHDAFLSQGGIPIKLMRELLMPGDSQRAL